MTLTPSQWTEEMTRMIESGIWKGLEWEDTNWKTYVKVSRIGATFQLNRSQRIEIMANLFEKVEAHYKREEKIALMHSVNGTADRRDFEGMILSRQEAIYEE